MVSVVMTRGVSENFSCNGGCAPLSTYTYYWPSFSRHTATTFSLTSTIARNGSLGNYPVIILIKGRAILCKPGGGQYLATYSDGASFTLVCLTPARYLGQASRHASQG
jgi:hypothetical protein